MSKNAELFARLKAQKDADKPFLAAIYDQIKKLRDEGGFWPGDELRFAFGVYGDWLSDTSRWRMAQLYWSLRDCGFLPHYLRSVRGPGGIPKAVNLYKKNYYLSTGGRCQDLLRGTRPVRF